jgi:uncharacterized protein YecE (DUF72 family)
VYRRAGEPCPRCERRIEAFRQGGRTTWWCPACQGGSAEGAAPAWPDGSRAPGADEGLGSEVAAPGGFFLGLPAWNLPELAGPLYPERTSAAQRLERYVERLTAVEGNTTFYATPTPETVARWASVMPPGFRFVAKVPRSISHEAELGSGVEKTLAFLARMQPLGERLGPLHLQLPPQLGPARLVELERFLGGWRERSAHPLLVEVRHPGWFGGRARAALLSLLSRHAAGRAFMDTRPLGDREAPEVRGARRKPDLPVDLARTAGHAMLRYIAHPRMECNAPWIAAWAMHLARWLAEGTTLYLFAHCPDEARAPDIARALQEALLAAGARVPPLPEPPPDERPRQLELF